MAIATMRPPTAAATRADPGVPLTPESAREHVATRALTPGPVGPVGLELEGHLVDLREPVLRVPWERVTAAVAALPPLPGGSAVTLEPGGQVELSGPPLPDASAAVAALRADAATLRASLAGEGLGLAWLGADPARPPARVNPGARYVAMEASFEATGSGPPGRAMMTSTASVQVNLDAGPERGWSERVALAHALGPVLVAVSACSPLLGGRESGWRSTRQMVWSDLDHARTGPLLAGTEPAQEWAEYALCAPVLLVFEASGGAVPVLVRTPFEAWADGRVALAGRRPTVVDLDYHLTTLFPPVRLRGFLEVRYLDAAPARWWPALAAVTATLLDVPAAAAVAAEATGPVATSWTRAARLGLADGALRRAATTCVQAALAHVPAALARDVERLADLVAQGRCPGDDVLRVARARGPLSALVEAASGAASGAAERRHS